MQEAPTGAHTAVSIYRSCASILSLCQPIKLVWERQGSLTGAALPSVNACSSCKLSQLYHLCCSGPSLSEKLVAAPAGMSAAWISLPFELINAALSKGAGPPHPTPHPYMPLAGIQQGREQGLPGWCRLCLRCCQPACTMRSCVQPLVLRSWQRLPRPQRRSPRWRPGCWLGRVACRSSRRPARRRRLSCTARSSTPPAPSAAS